MGAGAQRRRTSQVMLLQPDRKPTGKAQEEKGKTRRRPPPACLDSLTGHEETTSDRQHHTSWQHLLDLVTQLDSGRMTRHSLPLAISRCSCPAPGLLPLRWRPLRRPSSRRSIPLPRVHPCSDVAGAVRNDHPLAMIGVFYRCPAPGAPPFVELGARVEPDTTVGIIEVMKLMNPVIAGVTARSRVFW